VFRGIHELLALRGIRQKRQQFIDFGELRLHAFDDFRLLAQAQRYSSNWAMYGGERALPGDIW
jgi:hypothetical protein